MFMFPIMYYSLKQDVLTQTIVRLETKSLVDDIRSKGYLTREMYEKYIDKLSSTGMMYDIAIEHQQSVYEPEYTIHNLEDILQAMEMSYEGSNTYHYRNVATNIPVVNDQLEAGAVSGESNESVMASAQDIPALPDHIHSSACYRGHIHTDGLGIVESNYQHGCYTRQVSVPVPCPGTYHVTGLSSMNWPLICASCYESGHGFVSLINNIEAFKCNSCGHERQTNYIYCPNCYKVYQADSSVNGNSCSGATKTVYRCDSTEDNEPKCNSIIAAIKPTHPIQTVILGNPLITTAELSFLDGSKKTVVCSTDYRTDQIAEGTSVELTYNTNSANILDTYKCTILVNIISGAVTCDKGHSYYLKADQTDPGCPYCSAWLSSLTVIYPDKEQLSIHKGTTLVENGVVLLATYLDGHTEYLYTEYIDNLDSQYVGTQRVTVSYKGLYSQINVEVKRNTKACTECGRTYELYPDDTDPGCPYCIVETPVFTGRVMKYSYLGINNEIINKLYEGNGIYYFSEQDNIKIHVQNINISLGRNILSYIFDQLNKVFINIEYSGLIREDCN